ncbi:hypothetical protein AYC90_12730 [Salmonella enterica]|nr:hypothetical protein [Salmonella enterica]HCM1851418.1 hypothetical protein [Salmonella enterica subsp. salamae serovar 42:z29:-]EAU0239869.1 hypothetical protein [Salmonella enterica]EAX3602069.1 hypothetical protein [Salmonella enterica]EAY8295058.1 hypothetical protein [Salmonella enterica]
MISFENRLKSLKDRRQGTKERVLFENNMSIHAAIDLRGQESYELLAENAAIKYTIGAMAEVDPVSTRVSIDEGERVANTLIGLLNTVGILATKEIQGSVALNIHIEGHSDVDMLILKDDIVLVQMPRVSGVSSTPDDLRPMVDIIRELRLQSEAKLTSRYHQATVDCNGNKSIALSGGSLKRKVDIVPACWYHTHAYQQSRQKHDQEVKIYHKAEHVLYGNHPFLHIKKVNDKDSMYTGNLKRVVRLMKNVVADMPDYKKRVVKKLSSYDLTAIGYEMNEQLRCPTYMSLALVERLRAHLALLVSSKVLRDRLIVPDGSRNVFDSEEKVDALNILYNEISDLAVSIYRSLQPFSYLPYDSSTLTQKHVYL